RRSFPPGEARLRALVAAAVPLAQRRGTAAGLRDFLTVATGLEGFEVTESETRPFHLEIRYPETAVGLRVFVERLIQFQKPAYVTCELVSAG
ncbi:MAG: hypothetical protein KC425_25775, partial [Anaerolineales bacterium]|nr:hypothetical protein [Anaerolineales bacterium]